MNPFGPYAAYYDLLYQDKNYREECQYIDKLIKLHHPQASNLMDLGCGTGKHVALLSKMGYAATGVDRSSEMIAIAKANGPIDTGKLRFLEGDARNVLLEEQFDVVTALFHVMSYQTGNEDISSVFKTAERHLPTNGLFIFDCWYGPGVLSDPPVVRIKRMENEEIKVLRISEPVLFPNENRVDVHYDIQIHEKKNNSQGPSLIKEVHSMRYLFHPEIELYSKNKGFEIIDFREWMKDNKPGLNTWNAVFVCRKN
jgi:SAM-dependent methyltransferase